MGCSTSKKETVTTGQQGHADYGGDYPFVDKLYSSSVKEKDSGGQEIVIQGDVIWDLPALLEKEYKIPKSKIFEREKGGKLSKVR